MKIENKKEPVKLRTKKLKDGSKSIYLDIYDRGVRKYEYLRLYLLPDTRNNKAHNENVLKIAKAIKAQRTLDILNDKGGLQKNTKIKISQLIEEIIDVKKRNNISNSRICIYQSCRNVITKNNIDCDISLIDERYMMNFLVKLRNTLSNRGSHYCDSSVSCYYNCFGSVLNYAVRKKYIQINPISSIDKEYKPKKVDSDRIYLTAEEVKKLITTPYDKDPYIKNAFLFSCFCGLRYSDIFSLTWEDIEINNNRLYIHKRMIKTNTYISLPLSEQAVKFLPERKEKGLIFNTDIKTIRGRLNRLKEWVKQSGITKHVTYHIARHTFATLSLTADVDIYTLSKMLGHRSVLTTQIYGKIIEKKKERAADALSDFFNS